MVHHITLSTTTLEKCRKKEIERGGRGEREREGGREIERERKKREREA